MELNSSKVACAVVTGGIGQSFELPLGVVLIGVLCKAERLHSLVHCSLCKVRPAAMKFHLYWL